MKQIISILVKIETFGYHFLYEKAPRIPEVHRRLIAKYFVIGAVPLTIWHIISIIRYVVFEISNPSANYLYTFGSGGFGVIGVMMVGMAVVLELVAYPGLFHYKRQGWIYFFVGELLIVMNNLIHFNLINFIFGGLIIMYLLFQVRSYYH